MIARIAERAIWLEKLDETVLASGVRCTPRFRFRSLVSVSSCFADSDFIRIWNALKLSLPFGKVAPRPWQVQSDRPIAAACARTFESATGFGVTKLTCEPPLKSMPRFSPCDARETMPIRMIAPETANQR